MPLTSRPRSASDTPIRPLPIPSSSARLLPASFSAAKPVELMASEESNTQSRQEWLVDPCFEVVASLPERWHDDFAARVREGPCVESGVGKCRTP